MTINNGSSRLNRPSRPYPALFGQCNKKIDALRVEGVDAFDLMAICIRQGFGNPFFCACDSLFQHRLKQMKESGMPNIQAFMKALVTPKGPKRGSIPKFQWLDRNAVECFALAKKLSLGNEFAYLFQCRVGMVGAPAMEVMTNFPDEHKLQALRFFLDDVEVQLEWLVSRLALGAQFGSQSAGGMFAWYLESIGEVDAEPKGRAYASLAAHYRAQYRAADQEKHNV